MHSSDDVEDPLAVAARSEHRLVRALRRIGITIGSDMHRPYADIDALGEPVVVLGSLTAGAADRLAQVVEAAGSLARIIEIESPRGEGGGIA